MTSASFCAKMSAAPLIDTDTATSISLSFSIFVGDETFSAKLFHIDRIIEEDALSATLTIKETDLSMVDATIHAAETFLATLRSKSTDVEEVIKIALRKARLAITSATAAIGALSPFAIMRAAATDPNAAIAII
jgi:hypothetical protein